MFEMAASPPEENGLESEEERLRPTERIFHRNAMLLDQAFTLTAAFCAWSRVALIRVISMSVGCTGQRITSKAPRRMASRYSFHSPVCSMITKRDAFRRTSTDCSSSRED